jgi:hypothetical protein
MLFFYCLKPLLVAYIFDDPIRYYLHSYKHIEVVPDNHPFSLL